MSLIVRVSCGADYQYYFYSSGPHLDIGLDRHSLLSDRDPDPILFSAVRQDEQWFLQDYFNGAPAMAALSAGCCCRYLDYSLHFYPLSAAAAVLRKSAPRPAELPGAAEFAAAQRLSFNLAGCRHSYPIWPNWPLIVGSSPAAAITVPLSLVKGRHFQITLRSDNAASSNSTKGTKGTKGTVECQALEGLFAVAGTVQRRATLPLPGTVELLPLGLELLIGGS